jgi:hypothetical protein
LKNNICFDINHSIENFGLKKSQEQFKIAKAKIKEIHFSANVNSKHSKLVPKTPHFLFVDSEQKMPKIDFKGLFVIEGLIPKNRFDLLEREIDLIKKNY